MIIMVNYKKINVLIDEEVDAINQHIEKGQGEFASMHLSIMQMAQENKLIDALHEAGSLEEKVYTFFYYITQDEKETEELSKTYLESSIKDKVKLENYYDNKKYVEEEHRLMHDFFITTGYSTGNHLHFGVTVGGSYVSPWNYISRP